MNPHLRLLRRGFWLALPFGLAIAAAVAVQRNIDRFRLPDRQPVVGELTVANPMTAILVPRGTIIRAITVSEGDRVEAGQTLALIDPVRLDADQAARQARLAELAEMDRCLVAAIARQGGLPGAQEMEPAECLRLDHALSLPVEATRTESGNLAARLVLIRRAEGVATRQAQSADGTGLMPGAARLRREDRLRRLLDLALARNIAEAELAAAHRAFGAAQMARRVALDRARVATRTEAAALLREYAALAALGTRVTAPAPGVMARVALTDTADEGPAPSIGDLSLGGGRQFVIRFDLDAASAARIAPGDPIEAEIALRATGADRIEAVVTHVSGANPGQPGAVRTITAMPSDAAATALGQLPGIDQLNRVATRAILRIDLTETALPKAAMAALTGNIAKARARAGRCARSIEGICP